jgi:magnesium transporter
VQTVSKLRARRFPQRAGASLQRVSTVVADRPAPLSRVWSGNKIIAEDLTGEDLSDVLELHSDASAWWVLPRDREYGAVEVRHVAHALDLDEPAIKDLLAEDRRAKFETLGQSRLLITNAVSVDKDRAQIMVHPVSIIATDRAVICLVDPTPEFQPSKLFIDKQEVIAKGGVEAAVQIVIAAVIASYEEALQWLEDSSDRLADILFGERPLDKQEQLHAFKLRAALSQLRRLTDPMRIVMTDIVDSPPQGRKAKAGRDQGIARHWLVLSEHHTRIANAADALREALSSIFDTSLALADVRLNQIVKKLSSWAAIIAVPTLVTGFVGMNVHFPLAATTTGFWVYFLLMITASVVLYFVFRAKDWV